MTRIAAILFTLVLLGGCGGGLQTPYETIQPASLIPQNEN